MVKNEIDRLVAEKVMGWTYSHTEEWGGIFYDKKDKMFNSLLPGFATDIKHSWQVVEKMREKGYEFNSVWDIDKRFHAEFGKNEGGLWMYYKGIDELPSMAICLAALKAVS